MMVVIQGAFSYNFHVIYLLSKAELIFVSVRAFYFKNIAAHLPAGVHGAFHRLSITRSEVRREALRKTILAYYDAIPREKWTAEQAEAIAYLKSNTFCLVPYDWSNSYLNMPVKVYRDHAKKLNYAVLDDQKIYFRRYTDKGIVVKAVRELAYEQDVHSPHRYVTDENKILGALPVAGERHGHYVKPGDVVADVGAADGIFALSIADTASHIYLFECDPDWIPALEETFRDYNSKITLVPKFVSDTDSVNSITLDTFFKDRPTVSFLKADIEGAEPKMLRGAQNLLRMGRIQRASICVYHDVSHQATFEQLFRNNGYHVQFADGLMLNRKEPYMLKGVLWANHIS